MRWIIPAIAVTVILGCALGFAAAAGGITGETGRILLIVGAAVVVMLWAILWIIFPVFMYFGMRRQEKLLADIERNTRNPDQ